MESCSQVQKRIAGLNLQPGASPNDHASAKLDEIVRKIVDDSDCTGKDSCADDQSRAERPDTKNGAADRASVNRSEREAGPTIRFRSASYGVWVSKRGVAE